LNEGPGTPPGSFFLFRQPEIVRFRTRNRPLLGSSEVPAAIPPSERDMARPLPYTRETALTISTQEL